MIMNIAGASLTAAASASHPPDWTGLLSAKQQNDKRIKKQTPICGCPKFNAR